MDAIDSMDFDYVASGHYAKVVHPSADQMDKDSVLELSQDMVPKYNNFYVTFDYFMSTAIISLKFNFLWDDDP